MLQMHCCGQNPKRYYAHRGIAENTAAYGCCKNADRNNIPYGQTFIFLICQGAMPGV